MPVFSDSKGNVFRIPSSDLDKYKLDQAQIADLAKKGIDVAALTPASDDVELQEMQAPRVSTHAHNWFGGD